ncbi:MAG: pilus assembly protein TadG-related protein [Gemmatimonadota bacterium]
MQPRGGRHAHERGSILVLFGVVLPLILVLGAAVIDIGNWWVHGRHLQTKVDAAAFAGGSAWGFPCGTDIEANIEGTARTYVGEHTQADGAPFTATTFNPQVGGTPGSNIHVVLNGSSWWDDDEGSTPADRTSPLNPSICESKTLDVKATEENNIALFNFIPFFPDIKRKARVRIEEVDGLTGLLPIGVRLPQPLSAAAVFYHEGSADKEILAVKPFRQLCSPVETYCIPDAPPGLGQWTTEPDPDISGGSWARFNVKTHTGVVVATSVRPGCGVGDPPAGPPCLDTDELTWVGQSVDDFCQDAGAAVQCFDANGGGATQTVTSGLHFIRGYPNGTVSPGPNLPDLRSAWLENVSCPSTGYFNSDPAACQVALHVKVDVGSCMRGPGECFDDPATTPPQETRTASTPAGPNVQMRYCLVRAGQTGPVCETQFSEAQDMNCTGTGLVTCSTTATPLTHPQITPDSRQNAFAIEVRLRRTNVTDFPECQADGDFKDACRFFFVGERYFGDSVLPLAEDVLDSPVQRSFMGHLERTGPIEWLRLTMDTDCDDPVPTLEDRVIGHDILTGEDAASQPFDADRCYIVELGMAGGLAKDQDEPPIAFNLGENSSQRAYINCDDDLNNLKSEIVTGCQWPPYSANKFNTTPYCPENAGFFTVPKAPPFENWPPFRCVRTQTGNPSTGQIMHGFNERIFKATNPSGCPTDEPTRPVTGRNYWHRLNNDYDADTFAWDGTGSGPPNDPSGTSKGNTIRSDDPRLITLFFTTYDSFTSTGNEIYPIVGFGTFYVTGYGETIHGGWKGGAPEDPCDKGSGLAVGAGNAPPPDLDMSRNTGWVWGHFIKDVTPAPFTTGGSGELCNPEASFQPCVAVLVE